MPTGLDFDLAPVARLERVSYRYPNQEEPALRAVDATIEPGLTLVAGESGGGKSTLLRTFDGLVPQFHGGRISGRALVAGLDPFRVPIPRLARNAGLVFQDVETQSVYGSVEREIAFGLENVGMSRPRMRERVEEVLARLAIDSLRGRRLETLSGGERQRVQLASVLVLRPRLVALDEPTSQLDPEGAAALVAMCRDLAADGRAVVVAEHRHRNFAPWADRAIVVERGTVLAAEVAELRRAAAPAKRPSSFSGTPAWEMEGVAAGPGREPVVHDVSLAGGAGEVVAVLGPNGSGKTTLLRTLAGLIAPLSGTVRRPAGRTAYLPQNPGTLLHLPTIRAEVALTLRQTGSPESPEEMLSTFGLTGLAGRYPRDLSSGERQRAALAAILAGTPSLALLDEPTRGMDVAARRYLAGAVRKLTDRGSAVVLATHDTDLAAELADRVVDLRDGRVSDQVAVAAEETAR